MLASPPDQPAGEVDGVEPNAAPWRALEDPPPRSGDAADAPAGSEPRGAIPRSALLTAGVAVALVVGAFVMAFGSGAAGSVTLDGGQGLAPGPSTAAAASDPAGAGSGASTTLVVEIVGAVERPGVFRLPDGARIGDLVAAAGGYGARVDAERAGRELNLAALLHDGDQVRVPSRDDATASTTRAGGGASAAPNAPLDLNTATADQLDTLPGIGPVTAAKIIASRDEQRFAAVADLRTRKLVGEKTFAQLKDLVTVR
jgi:competence protein ComEA